MEKGFARTVSSDGPSHLGESSRGDRERAGKVSCRKKFSQVWVAIKFNDVNAQQSGVQRHRGTPATHTMPSIKLCFRAGSNMREFYT